MKSSELKPVAAIAIPLLTVLGFLEDIHTKQGTDDWVWYFVALVLTIFFNQRSLPFILAPIFTLLTLLGYYFSPPGPVGDTAIINCLMGVGVLWITAVMIYLRKKVELALRKSEIRYRFLFKNMQTGFAHCQMIYKDNKPVDFIYLSVNPAFERITGLNGVVGRRVTEVIPNIRETQPELLETYGKVASTGKPKKFEYYLQVSKIWLSVSSYCPARGYFVTTFENVTERKRAEGQSNLFRALVDRSSDGIEVVEPETGRFHDVNEATCRRLGYTREELLTLRVSDIDTTVKPSDWPDIVNDLRQRRAVVVEGCQRRKDGTTFPVEVNIRWVELDREYIVAVVRDITERKKAEAELLLKQQQFFSLGEHVPASIAMFDRDMRYMITSRQWAVEYGRGKDNLTGFSYYEQNPDISQEWRDVHRRALAGEYLKQDEDLWLKPDGNKIWVRWAVSPWKEVHGEIGGIIISAVNITESKKAEDVLRKLSVAVEQSPASIVITNKAGNIEYVNPKFCEVTGYSAAEVLGKNPRILKSGEMPPEGYKQLWKTITSGHTWRGEFHNRKKNGELYWELAAISPIYNGNGQIANFLAVKEDITERRLAQEELTLKTAFLGAQVESTLDGILVVDAQTNVILQNKRFAEIFKVPAEILANPEDTQMRSWVTGRMKDPEQFNQRVSYLYAHPDEIGQDEIPLVDGTILDRYSAPVRDKNGKHYGRIWAFRDITGRRKLEAQLLQVQKMEGIGQLAGGVAHDFNNILGVIQMQAGLLKSSGGLSTQQLDFADEISVTVLRAAALTRQLLLFSRREVFQPRDFDLSESVTGTSKMLRRILGEAVEMQLNLASQPMFIHADPGMMDQILMNLAVNARDAMAKGGQLNIETSSVEFTEADVSQSPQARPGSFVCLTVSDNGAGIPAEVLPRIFEPFFTTKDVGKGTGLGLATVFGIVEQHQGWIDVQSHAGRGTTFCIYLPRLIGSSNAKKSQIVLKDIRGGNETILLAEDDPSLRVSVRNALSQLGYRILEAPTAAKALDVWKASHNEISLLLTDLVMPGGMTGKDLAEAILKENPRLEVIYMSGYSAEIAGNNFSLKDGVNFLAKPFQAARLAQIVRNRLDKSVWSKK